MNKDWLRDQWVDDNIPDEKTFDKGFVKHLMRQAYDEGKVSQERRRKAQEEEDRYGPS